MTVEKRQLLLKDFSRPSRMKLISTEKNTCRGSTVVMVTDLYSPFLSFLGRRWEGEEGRGRHAGPYYYGHYCGQSNLALRSAASPRKMAPSMGNWRDK